MGVLEGHLDVETVTPGSVLHRWGLVSGFWAICGITGSQHQEAHLSIQYEKTGATPGAYLGGWVGDILTDCFVAKNLRRNMEV